MLKLNTEFKKVVSGTMGRRVGKVYTEWHEKYSERLTYGWLAQNNYSTDVVLEPKYQERLSIYLVEQFLVWFRHKNEG